ncbi:metastasis suppressor protein 1-like isoform X2 [Trichoplusia ni]|uniref:Metastasis suppressor protein 1-like isoform X2 n=1 Tax=Trichoplusia ni TaxID=7111 RepID=A0A7E5W5P2_TRINI|nr:metastasis suppressor protein 1-like isoform X2 [Trichoplusia ni]
MTMEGTTEKDCSPLWNLYQQIVSDMKNSAPMWEEFISKATKLHSALKSALVAIAAFLDAFQKIADAATNARGATKEIGTALTRVCLRHRAIETRMKTFISALMDTLITPLSERADEWRRGSCATGALSREHARECKRARAELRRRVTEAQRHARKARRAPPDAKRRADVCMQDIQERKQQLEEMEEKAVKAALIEERSRFCHFVSLLNPVVESEVAMLAEVGHLQEGTEQLIRHTAEPRTLPAASLQVICDIKSCYSGWAESVSAPHSPSASSRLGSRKSSLTSISSLNSQCSDNQHGVSGSTVSCSTPISNASSAGTIPAPSSDSQHCLTQCGPRLSSVCSADSGFRSQDALLRRSLYADHGSDNQSVSSECINQTKSNIEDDNSDDVRDVISNAASATWPDLKDTAQFERAASAIMGGRPHTISAAYSSGHPRAALSAHTFSGDEARDGGIYARPPLPTRCSSLERPQVPTKSGNANTCQQEFKPTKPSSLPPHLTKEMPQALYVNMSELATLAASRAQQQHNAEHPQQEKVCSESSASESSLESSSGYGSQGAFAAEEHAHQHQVQHADVESEIVTLRRDSDASVAAARESFSISLGSLEEAVRCLDEASETPVFATIGKKPAVPKRRPLSMTATVWSRRGSSSSLGKPPPPVRRSSSISRPQRPPYMQNTASPGLGDSELPPPPAFLLQPDADAGDYDSHINVAETVKQLTELKHMPASPGIVRRSLQQLQNQNNANPPSPTQPSLSTFQQAKSNFSSSTSLNSTGNLNPIYGQTGHRIMAYVENSMYVRKNSLNSSNSDLLRDSNSGIYGEGRGSPHGSSPSTPSYGENNSFSSFGPRMSSESHYGQTGFKMQQERQDKKYQNTIYAQPSDIIAGFNSMSRHDALSPLALRKNIAARSHSADRHHLERGLIASLSAKLAPQLSPRTSRRAISTITAADPPAKGKGTIPSAVQPAFLDKLSATIQQQRRQLDSSRAKCVRDMISAHAQPDPRACHTSLMEQIKRGATLRRNKHCNDRSAPKIR